MMSREDQECLIALRDRNQNRIDQIMHEMSFVTDDAALERLFGELCTSFGFVHGATHTLMQREVNATSETYQR